MELEQILLKIKPQIVDGEIRQLDGDSGDSAQRDGTFWAIVGMLTPRNISLEMQIALSIFRTLKINYEQSMRNHEITPGYYRRTNNPKHWGYAGNNFARDQHSVLRLAFALMGDTNRLKESALAMLKRCLFHQNYHIGTDTNGKWYHDYRIPDLMHPNEWAVIIRGLGLWILYPLLLVTDLCFLADLYLRKFSADYDNMLMQQLAYAVKKYPTPISKLAWHLYDKEDALKKIDRYHSTELGNGISGFVDLFRLLVESIDGTDKKTALPS